jgi:hypothetical protein
LASDANQLYDLETLNPSPWSTTPYSSISYTLHVAYSLYLYSFLHCYLYFHISFLFIINSLCNLPFSTHDRRKNGLSNWRIWTIKYDSCTWYDFLPSDRQHWWVGVTGTTAMQIQLRQGGPIKNDQCHVKAWNH